MVFRVRGLTSLFRLRPRVGAEPADATDRNAPATANSAAPRSAAAARASAGSAHDSYAADDRATGPSGRDVSRDEPDQRASVGPELLVPPGLPGPVVDRVPAGCCQAAQWRQRCL